MRLTELWQSRQRPTISFELFPAHTTKAQAKLEPVIDALAGLSPDFVSVTFGAGGSTREGSRQLAAKLREERKLGVLPYFAGYGLAPTAITEILDDYHTLGLESLLVVRGDPSGPEADFTPHPDSFDHASEMIEFIHQHHGFCIGAAGYPEAHREAVSKAADIEFLKLKVERGASFIISQYFYDNSFFLDFCRRCRAVGVEAPIVPGVMPIFSVKLMESLSTLCGATITPEVRDGIAALPEGDKDALLQFGVDLAVRQCEGLLAAGVPGLHIYTMDRAESAVAIIKRLREGGHLQAS